mmetsp:Transcript_18971/g.27429  ORF Transcript_18971/g.27429 Transcript_18971/m.27429 type:complete len:95 (+) Transcript_18971:195-479(+)
MILPVKHEPLVQYSQVIFGKSHGFYFQCIVRLFFPFFPFTAACFVMRNIHIAYLTHVALWIIALQHTNVFLKHNDNTGVKQLKKHTDQIGMMSE